MRNYHRFIVLLLCILFGLTGYKAYAYDPQTLSLVLQGDPNSMAELEQAIKDNPNIIIPKTRSEYSIKIIKPNPGIDYKIVEIMPDPTVDYDIIIIDPNTGRKTDNQDRWLGRELRKKLHGRHKK
jgi:hypothetical protein